MEHRIYAGKRVKSRTAGGLKMSWNELKMGEENDELSATTQHDVGMINKNVYMT